MQMESEEDPVVIFHLSQFEVLPVTCEASKEKLAVIRYYLKCISQQ